tara:strand:+ start:10868 stop:11023 length:156 start_codon:yes stop_codon:yes gene_type:complete
LTRRASPSESLRKASDPAILAFVRELARLAAQEDHALAEAARKTDETRRDL